MRTLHSIAGILWISIALLLLPTVVAAQQDPGRRPWTFRFQLGGVGVSENTFIGIAPGRFSIRTEDSATLGIAFERRMNRLVGLELSVLHSDPSVVATFQSPHSPNNRTGVLTALGMTPLSLGLNLHVIPRGKVDLYVGPVLSYILYDDLHLYAPGVPSSVAVDDETTYGFQIGLNLRVGRGPWAFNAALRGLRASPETRELESPSLDIDPLFATVGFGYSF